jgi:DNA-binding MarR family transcriptional regulator
VARKLARRERSATDRRQLECFITDAGLQVLDRLDDEMDRADTELARGLEPRYIQALIEGLQHMRDRAVSR